MCRLRDFNGRGDKGQGHRQDREDQENAKGEEVPTKPPNPIVARSRSEKQMPYIPENACWYIAEIVEEINVEDSPESVVHRNLVLIKANSPNDAYEKALDLGRQSEASYNNPKGKKVTVRFVGLRELCVVYDELDHGAELMYTEEIGLSAEDVAKLASPKDQLSIFHDQPPAPETLDYSALDVVAEANEILADRARRTV